MQTTWIAPVENCFCTTKLQELLLIDLDAFQLLRGDLLSLSLPVSISSLENNSDAVAAIARLTIFQRSDLDAQLLENLSTDYSANVYDCLVKKHKR